LFDFAVLDLVSSILSHKTGLEECLQNGQFCVNCNIKKVMLSVKFYKKNGRLGITEMEMVQIEAYLSYGQHPAFCLVEVMLQYNHIFP